jgi:ABC-type polar amino acid transport system ATPase subunit
MTAEPGPRASTELVVELRGIKKSFGSTEVLHGVDLRIHAGEHVVIFGPSGSGKSTVLRTINLLEEPTEGSVRVFGVEYGPGLPGENSKRGGPLELRRHVGMVFQQFNLFPHLTALHNIALPLRSVKQMTGARQRNEPRSHPSGRASPLAASSRPSSPAGSSSGWRSRAR